MNDYICNKWKYMFYALSNSKTWSFLYPYPILSFTHLPKPIKLVFTNTYVDILLSIKFSLCFAEWTTHMHFLLTVFVWDYRFPTYLEQALIPRSQACAVHTVTFCVVRCHLLIFWPFSGSFGCFITASYNWTATQLFAGNAWQQELILLFFIT